MKSVLALALIATLMACAPEGTPEAAPVGKSGGGTTRDVPNNEEKEL